MDKINKAVWTEGYMTEYKRALEMKVDLKKRPDLFIINFSRHYMLFNMIKKVHKLFKKNKIDYFMICGLLIGLKRHNQSFIPWDDDLDIGVMLSQKSKIMDIINNSEDFYILHGTCNVVDKICYKYDKNMGSYDENVFIDIFYFEEKDNIYQYASIIHRSIWPREYFNKDELLPLKKSELKIYLPNGDLADTTTIMIPSNIDAYLNRSYPNYLSNMISDHTHVTMYEKKENMLSKRVTQFSIIHLCLSIIYYIYKYLI